MTDENELTCYFGRWRAKAKPDKAVRLGETLAELMNNQIMPRQEAIGMAVELWEQLLPAELRRHCEIVDIAAGRLKVRVDSPSYLQELRLCSPELLGQFQEYCPRAQIKAIKLVYQ